MAGYLTMVEVRMTMQLMILWFIIIFRKLMGVMVSAQESVMDLAQSSAVYEYVPRVVKRRIYVTSQQVDFSLNLWFKGFRGY